MDNNVVVVCVGVGVEAMAMLEHFLSRFASPLPKPQDHFLLCLS